jgi:serine/threonine protein kinase
MGASYSIERELGGGGMSRVFVAEESALGRRVVVKVLSPDLAAAVSVERFKREIALAARLQHPHIVPLLMAGEAGGLPYFTMPLVEGESLRQRLTRGAMPTDEAVEILRDMAQALEYAHSRDVVHRDIKPENILLTGRAAVVTDFGIARAITAATWNDSRGSTLTAHGTIVGTPAYMAPEQAAGGEVDARADIYAWGVIAYEIFAGTHPFASRTTAQALLAAHIAEAPAPLATKRSDLPAPMMALVDRCLAKNPDDRPADSSALLALLGAAASPATPRPALSRAKLVPAVIAVALIVVAGGWTWHRSDRRRWARTEAITAIRTLSVADLSLAAFMVFRDAQRYAPTDSQLTEYAETETHRASLTSSPPGAKIELQDYLSPDSGWYVVGETPLKDVRIPNGYFRWRISKPKVGSYVIAPLVNRGDLTFFLDSALTAPAGMVRIAGSTWGNLIAFVGWVGDYRLPTFYIDRFEVTNRQYQAFVDSGGYAQAKYWDEKFVRGGREMPRGSAMALFRDRTGRPGPSTWEGGHFPEGRGDYPVSGVSWYEAKAYAAFAGKSLPAFAQWYRAAPPDAGMYIARESNISRTDVAPVGSFHGIGPFGTYDMAGNVREWTLNALDADRRFILGGAARSLTYLYADPEALSPFDRSPEDGFRCVKNVTPLTPDVIAAVKPLERDFTKYRPASDEVFRAYQKEFAYNKSPLNAKVDTIPSESKDWRKEKITFDAAYGGERMSAYLFVPMHVRPPYQTVLFFPSARVAVLPSSATLGDTDFFDYVVQSGRAVLYPVYKGIYERSRQGSRTGASQPIDLKIERSRDVGRSLDYLQSRSDIAGDKLAYLGVSMGSAEGVIYATLAQDRLKTVVLLDGGFFLGPPPAGGDQADYAPRLKVPVLMVNGRYDFSFSLEKSQNTLFRALGTPDADKRHIVLDTPHDVRARRPELTAAVLGWLDKYLGRVQ